MGQLYLQLLEATILLDFLRKERNSENLILNMKIQNKEKLRAFNIIWNASADYSFQPEINAYDERGKADLYWNYIIGAVHKYYDYSLIQNFFSYVKDDIDYDIFQNLTWMGLENCAYEKGKDERPVLEDLRRSYAERVLKNGNSASADDIYDKVKIAHFQRVLGEEPKITGPALNLLNDLEFDESMSTEQIIQRMNEIIKDYFEFSPAHNIGYVLNKMVKNRKMIHFGESRKQNYQGIPFLKRIDIGSAELSGSINFDENKEKQNKLTFHWLKFKEQMDKDEREYIQNYFGNSIIPEPQTRALEQILCSENHKNCHLHFTRGEFDENEKATYQKKVALMQREKNKKHYKENSVRNNNSISKLTNRIKNTMLVNPESSPSRSKTGKIAAEKIWRNIYLHDSKVFIRNLEDDIGDLTVDILLDASASQLYRQETIAVEGFIIAESLTRCQIPVRVYSFCNMRNYTVINLFRDYSEVNKNDNIFNYCAAGFNRDGLAIRTALHMMKNSSCENKILIVLSDGKPNDLQKIPASGIIPVQHEYEDEMGVNDTAKEVRKGQHNGISILCVFTGQDEDIPSAKKIYGHNLARIKSPERFADIVGVLIQNELKNLR